MRWKGKRVEYGCMDWILGSKTRRLGIERLSGLGKQERGSGNKNVQESMLDTRWRTMEHVNAVWL